jgi:uncharacterized Zn-binding protein involved in type VI secretion
MANLELKGTLDFRGMLTLQGAGGGKVTAGGQEVLVEQVQCQASPVIQPPPPASPLDPGPTVRIISSLNKTVTAAGKAIVAMGMVLQGNVPTWPGMVMRGSGTVTVNQIPMNVLNEQATIFPSGGSAVFNSGSGQ